MLILPAIDLVNGCAVRLFKGDYDNMTVYSKNPLEVALKFKDAGAEFIHLVDLEGARDGDTPNIDVVENIVKTTGIPVEIGGGIRSMEVINRYLSIGVNRVILGTAAVTDEELLKTAVEKYGDAVAVGVDVKDGFVAIKGWLEKSQYTLGTFFEKLSSLNVNTVICTDISKDGAMQGANHELYRELSSRFSLNIIASGGVSSMDDISRLRKIDLYGAIIGKAYYVGAINLKEAIETAK
jgi:phosphoribosylformimino-5-aminoimidazole carboxamide ribotide isomerase